MKKILYIVILILLINVSFIYQYYGYKKRSKNKIDQMGNIVENYKIIVDAFKSHIYNSYEFNGYKLNRNIELISLDDEEKTILKNLIKNNKKLIFYIPSKLCNTCYKRKIEKLKEHRNKIGKQELLILVPLGKIREYKVLLSDYNLKERIYAYKKEILSNESFLSPLYFICEPDFRINDFFIIHKNYDLVGKYIDIVQEKYFDTNN